ncbi:MAG: alkaline phosphatase family protein, partial [Planctomycetaceae bacterium]|nr:alkaline phosphatase family protein [Planctomycetaceae bacterium]
MKKVLLVVIDALASRIIVPAMKDGKLPCLAALASRGVLRPECTSIFPSITPAATASIVTGVYPVQHDIAGAFWFDREEDSVAYYGDDFWVLVNEGVGTFFDDFLVRLDHGRLHADTLYQIVERNNLTAAAINFMWFRGETKHPVNAPLLFQLLPGVEIAPQVMGPQVLALADFAVSNVPGSEEPLAAAGGLTRRYGFHDETTAEYLMHLATGDPFPDFTLAYFPNNDFVSHDKSPAEALEVVQEVDHHLAEFIDTVGGMDAFLAQFAIVIVGDHSQCDMIRDVSGRGINLVEVLDGYQLATAGQPWLDEDDIMVCPNMRSCHIYLQKRDSANRDEVVERLLKDPRVDQIMWRASAWNAGHDPGRVDPRTDSFHVTTAERGSLEFRHVRDE